MIVKMACICSSLFHNLSFFKKLFLQGTCIHLSINIFIHFFRAEAVLQIVERLEGYA